MNPKKRRACFAVLLSFAAASCAREMEHEAGDALDPKGETAPLPSGAGALDKDFDADRVAPMAAAEPGGHEHHQHPSPAASVYTCPHHPDVISDKPGTCPKCGMDLVPKPPPKP